MSQSARLFDRSVSRTWRYPVLGMPGIWLVIIATGACEVVWAKAVGVTFTITFISWLLAAVVMAFAVPYRVSGRSVTIADGLEVIAICSVFTHAGCVLTYLAARTNRPLVDAAYAAADAQFGFSWPAWQAAVVGHPFVEGVLHCCYTAMWPQLAGVVLLAFMGYGTRAREFIWTAIVALGLTTLIAGWFPAEGAPAFFGINLAGRDYQDILELRGTAPVTFALDHLTGIVTFPSYHAALAVAYIRVYRKFGWWTWAAIIVNAMMTISALASGGHYLVDLLGGIIVAVMAIGATRWAMRYSFRTPRASDLGSSSA
jgi:hypothetical protein